MNGMGNPSPFLIGVQGRFLEGESLPCTLQACSGISPTEWLTASSWLLGRTPSLTLPPFILPSTTNMGQWLLEREKNSRAILYWRWNNSSAWKVRAAVAASTSTSNAACSLPAILNPLWTPDFTYGMVAPWSNICVLVPIHCKYFTRRYRDEKCNSQEAQAQRLLDANHICVGTGTCLQNQGQGIECWNGKNSLCILWKCWQPKGRGCPQVW